MLLKKAYKFGIGAIVVSAIGLVSGSSFAQKQPAPPVQYKKTTTYDFDDDLVEGELQAPDGELISGSRRAKHTSLIKVRENFIPEMLKSAEDI